MTLPTFLADEDLRGAIVGAVRRLEPAIELVRAVDVGLAGKPDAQFGQTDFTVRTIVPILPPAPDIFQELTDAGSARDTEFQQVAGVENIALNSGPLTMTASDVAEAAYKGLVRGKRLVVPGVHNKIGVQSVRVSPRAAVLKVVRQLHRGH